MPARSRLAFVSLLAYLGGGVIAPVAHLARHRSDHTHGPGDEPIGLQVHDHEPSDVHDPDHHDEDGPAGAPQADPSTVPAGSDHGHGSLAHFGLALLPAPPPLELPAPAPAGAVPLVRRERSGTLHRPSFPLPRPPPASAPS